MNKLVGNCYSDGGIERFARVVMDILGICRVCAGDLGHSRSVSRRVPSIFFQLELIMCISNDVQEFINTLLAQNNAALLGLNF